MSDGKDNGFSRFSSYQFHHKMDHISVFAHVMTFV